MKAIKVIHFYHININLLLFVKIWILYLSIFFNFSCFETCYWHLIEERFCFDETIASYQEPIAKEEKNNNLFDNMAFYDSVSVIAGRSIVTIDPLPEKKNHIIVEVRDRLII